LNGLICDTLPRSANNAQIQESLDKIIYNNNAIWCIN